MKNRMNRYIEKIEDLLGQDRAETAWQEILTEHIQQIQMFQHERLIHLLVTLFFALMEIVFVGISLVCVQIGSLVLAGMTLILLIPYIGHYYFLENKTQYLYELYDKIRQKF